MTLAELTTPALMIPALRGHDVPAVLQELSQTMWRQGRVPDQASFYQAALNREFLVGTETDAGIAFPHARLIRLRELSFALGRCPQPIRWGQAASLVRLVFLMAAPADDSVQYLSLISGLVRLGKEPHLIEKLQNASEAAEMFEVLQQVTLRTSRPLSPVA